MAPGSRPSFIETRKLICFQCKGDMNVERAFENSHQNSERRGITEELEELQRDMVELNQVLSVVNRYMVKDTILAEINLISAKMESLREQTAQYSNKELLWSDIVARRKKPTTYHHKPQQIPVINNRYNLFSLSDSDTNSSSAGHRTTVSGVNIKRNKYKDPKKIIILGDSHARGCAQEVRHNLGKDFAVQGLVKPGAVSETLVNTANKITEKITKKDVVVVWGGTRDVGRNESRKGLQQISDSVKKHNQTNVIVIGVPYRHDLEPDSCVNEEVKVFNRKLKKHLKVFSNTRVIEVESNRDLFTRHGLHMNAKGKEHMAKKIGEEIKVMLTQRKSDPIRMMMDNEDPGATSKGTETKQKETQVNRELTVKQTDSLSVDSSNTRSSSKQKKAPITMSEDFLW